MKHIRSSGGRVILVGLSPVWFSHRSKLQGVYDYALKAGWNIETIYADELRQPIASVAELSSYDGFILDVWGPVFGSVTPKALSRPVVLIDPTKDWRDEGFDGVLCDPHAIGVEAARALAAIGPGTLAFVSSPFPYNWADERGKAFLAAARALGRPTAVWRPRNPGAWRDEQPRLAAWLADLPKPCAVFAPMDATAAFALRSARLAGLRVPEDMAILGADNDVPLCEGCCPALSSILLDFEGAGRRAAEMLDEQFAALEAGRAPAPPRLESYGPLGIVSRGSTRRPKPNEHPRLARGLAFISRNAGSGITVGDVARAMNLSRRSAEYAFSDSGLTIRGCIRDTQLDRVRDMLVSTRKPVDVIVCLCGFSSASHCAPLFKRRFGATMTEVRRTASSGIP